MRRMSHLTIQRVLVVCFSLCISVNIIQAQRITTAGKEFYVGFMDNYLSAGGSGPVLRLRVSAPRVTTGMVSIGPAYTQPFSVVPGVVTTVDIPSSLANVTNSETVEDKGVKVTSEDTIYVFAENYIQFTTDATVALPTPALGYEYLVSSYQGAPEFLVVATQDNTEIEITPSDDTYGGNAQDDPFMVTLNTGQTFLVKGSSGGDLTGSRVRCIDPCKPVAVYGGDVCVNVPSNMSSCDHLYEQLYPINTWGKTYITVPFKTRGGEIFRILGAYNNTKVAVDENGKIKTYTLKKSGDFKDVELKKAGKISADKPVAVAQFSPGDSYDGDDNNGDPFMLMLTPVEQKIDNITFSIIIPGNDVHYANVFTKTSNVSSVTLNGASIASGFTPLKSDTSISYIQQLLPTEGGAVADFTLKGKDGFNACVYGFGFDNSYGYSAGGRLDNLAFDFTYTDSLCAGNEFTFTDTIQFVPTEVLWEFGDGATSTSRDPKHIYTTPGKYKVKFKVRESACLPFRETDKLVTVFAQPDAPVVSGNELICSNESVTLVASSYITDISFEWYDVPGGVKLSNSAVYITPSLAATTTYYVLLRTKTCISDVQPVTVTVIPSPTSAEISSSTDSIKKGESVEIEVKKVEGGSGNYTYTWIPDIGNGAGPYVLTPALSGTYIVTIADADKSECSYTDSISIFVETLGFFHIPNAFSPNNDKQNDGFVPEGSGFTGYHMSIYDRWGKRLYDTDDFSAPWNGKVNNSGAKMPMGIYIYVIKIVDGDGKPQTYTGTLSLTE